MNIKTIAIASIAVVAGMAYADRDAATIQSEYAALTNDASRVAYKMTMTTEEWRSMADALVALSNSHASVAAFDNSVGITYAIGSEWSNYANAKALAGEYDAKFAAADIKTCPMNYKYLPLTCENWFNSTNKFHMAYNAAHPLRIAATRRVKSGEMSLKVLSGFAEWVNIIAEDAAAMNTNGFTYGFVYSNLAKKKSDILQSAVKVVKMELRRQGKSFVVQPDGKNPVQDAIDELSVALDAPKMQGLGTWMSTWCPDYTWVEPTWLADAAVNAYKEKIFLGDKAFTSEDKYHLCSYLGVTEYNKFVREYNGETAAQ